MKKKSLQNIYENYIGSGNPNAKYWFIGYEAGGSITDPEIFNNYKSKSEIEFINFLNAPLTDQIEKRFYHMLKNIIEKLNLSDCIKGNNFNITEKSNAFFTLLYPLNFQGIFHSNNENHLHFFNKIFNEKFRSLERTQIIPNTWIQKRAKKLNSFFIQKEKTIFIFKRNRNYLYEQLLNITIDSDAKGDSICANNSKVEFYDIKLNDINHQLIIAPNNLNSENVVNKICEKVLKYENPPRH